MFVPFLALILSIPLIILIIYLKLNSTKIKGQYGEYVISKKLFTLPDEYFLFNDIYLYVDGRSVQIDHIVISKYGIFVIETKNYKGWIFGNEKSDYWTKSMYGRKYKFRNPIKQNYSHLKSLQTLLNAPEYIFEPIVVFLNKAELKFTHRHVIYGSELNERILSRKHQLLTDEMIKKYVHILSLANIQDEKQRKKHIYSVRNEIAYKEHLVKSRICPKCNANLVERNGRNGVFLGCSNYPKCRFTANL